MDMPVVSLMEIERYLKVARKHGAETMSILGRLNKHFSAVMETEVGKEILKYDVDRLDELLSKIYMEKTTKQELAEFRVLKRRVRKEIDLIQEYLEKIGEVKKVINVK